MVDAKELTYHLGHTTSVFSCASSMSTICGEQNRADDVSPIMFLVLM